MRPSISGSSQAGGGSVKRQSFCAWRLSSMGRCASSAFGLWGELSRVSGAIGKCGVGVWARETTRRAKEEQRSASRQQAYLSPRPSLIPGFEARSCAQSSILRNMRAGMGPSARQQAHDAGGYDKGGGETIDSPKEKRRSNPNLKKCGVETICGGRCCAEFSQSRMREEIAGDDLCVENWSPPT